MDSSVAIPRQIAKCHVYHAPPAFVLQSPCCPWYELQDIPYVPYDAEWPMWFCFPEHEVSFEDCKSPLKKQISYCPVMPCVFRGRRGFAMLSLLSLPVSNIVTPKRICDLFFFLLLLLPQSVRASMTESSSVMPSSSSKCREKRSATADPDYKDRNCLFLILIIKFGISTRLAYRKSVIL